jgi:tripartite ATP-independent transporter DctM subunit
MSLFVFFGLIIGLIAFGCPVVTAFLGGSMAYFLLNGLGLQFALKIMLDGTSSFILMAVPLFIFVAYLFDLGTITDRLFAFANKMVGHHPGGLAHVNIFNSLVFSGMSGSAIADTTGIGAMSARAMMREGYSAPFSAAVTISGSLIGPIIPPSIPAVIIAAVTNVSVGKIFMGGIGPGIVMALGLFAYCYWISLRRGYPRAPKARWGERMLSLYHASGALLTPVILIGGIYTGIFTPTEAAAVASVYGLGLVIYYMRGLDIDRLMKATVATVQLTGMVMLLVASVSLITWIITVERVPQFVAIFVADQQLGKYGFLAVLNVVLLILGALLPTEVIIFLFVPIVFPAAQVAGVDPVHFCVVVLVNLMIGLNTPPFGLNLFVASGVLKVPVKDIISETWPMLIVLVGALLCITYIEPIVTFLPSMM